MRLPFFLALLLLPAITLAQEQRTFVPPTSLDLRTYLGMVEASFTAEKLQIEIERQKLDQQNAEKDRKFRVNTSFSLQKNRADQTYDYNPQSNNQVSTANNRTLNLTVTQPLPVGGEFALSYAPTLDMSSATSAGDTTSPVTRTSPVRWALTLPLLKGNGRRIANDSVIQSEINVRSGSLQYAIAMDTLMLSALDAYLNVLNAQEQITVTQAAYQSAKVAKHNASERVRLGVGTVADVTSADLSLLSAQGSVLSAESALASSLSAMAKMVNYSPGWSVSLLPVAVSDEQLATVRQAPVPVELSNEVRVAMLALESVEQAAYVTKNALLPDVNFVLEKNRTTSQISGLSPDGSNTATSSSIGLTFSKTLDDHNAKANDAKAQDDIKIARFNVQVATNDLLQSRAIAENDLSIGQHQIALAQQYLNAAETNLRNENRKYEMGRSSLYFVTVARDALTSAKLGLNAAKASYLRSAASYALYHGRVNELLNILKEQPPSVNQFPICPAS